MDASLGERELDVMGELWHGGPGTVAEIRDRLPVALAYNTVLTILRNLESKGFVGHTANGRLFCYFPAVSEQSVRGSALSRLVDKLFRGSPAGVVAHLVEAETLSADDIQSLHRLLAERLPDAKASAGETERAHRSSGTAGVARNRSKNPAKRRGAR